MARLARHFMIASPRAPIASRQRFRDFQPVVSEDRGIEKFRRGLSGSERADTPWKCQPRDAVEQIELEPGAETGRPAGLLPRLINVDTTE